MVILASCPKCGSTYMVETQGKIEATHVSPDPDGESRTEVTESVSRVGCSCHSCGVQFFLFVRHQAGETYAVETSPSRKFRDPKETIEALNLRYDRKKEEWQKIVGDKVVGPLVLHAKARKR
jgi:hypothetical protein